MNKQEAIEKIEKEKSNLNAWEDLARNRALDDALAIIRKLDEPVKPIVPQFVADWYEEHKDNLEYSIQCLCVHGCLPVRKIDTWFDSEDNKPIETLVKMKIYGYEVEKKKLYFASFRDTGQYLGWNEQRGEWFMSCTPFTSGVEQTQETWEAVRIWNNPAFEIKEVENDYNTNNTCGSF